MIFKLPSRKPSITLTHCRFEASKQISDDSVLLKVVTLLRDIITSSFGDYLSDTIIYDVLTTLSLACNTHRSEVLRKTAEVTIAGITVKRFTKVQKTMIFHLQKQKNISMMKVTPTII